MPGLATTTTQARIFMKYATTRSEHKNIWSLLRHGFSIPSRQNSTPKVEEPKQPSETVKEKLNHYAIMDATMVPVIRSILPQLSEGRNRHSTKNKKK